MWDRSPLRKAERGGHLSGDGGWAMVQEGTGKSGGAP